jgi:outer membrane lipoprotein carrier protein
VVTSTGAIDRMKLEEVDGAITEFSFAQMQEDVPVSDTDFKFTPPAGVTVVQGLPPI